MRASTMIAPMAFGCASAQAQISPPRLLRTPYAQAVAGNEQRFIILPSVTAAYETNTVPYSNGSRNGNVGNGRVTPGIDVVINRLIGATRFTLSGQAGYDFNTRFKSLNQPRINLGSSAAVPIGGRCTLGLGASYRQFRFDQSDLTQTINAKSRQQGYSGNFSCPRAVGFSPVVGASYIKQTSDDLAIFDYTTIAVNGGLSYAKPSLGVVSVTVGHQTSRRPEIRRVTGIDDRTDVNSINVGLSRAVSPRLQLQLSGGYFKADPHRAGVRSTSGLSYDATVVYAPSPRFTVTASAARNVTNEGGVSATYVTVEDYRLGLGWRLSAPSAVNLEAQRTHRSFRGEDILNATSPIGRDRVTQVAASYSLDALTRLRFTAGVRHLWRDSANRLYDYQTTIFSASVGARF